MDINNKEKILAILQTDLIDSEKGIRKVGSFPCLTKQELIDHIKSRLILLEIEEKNERKISLQRGS